MTVEVPLWLQVLTGLLLLASGAFTLLAGVGMVRLKTFFERMHPPALAFVAAAWCVTLATIVFFSSLGDQVSLQSWLIIILLSITVPITSFLLSRAALFRLRQAGRPAPPPLRPREPQR